MNHLNTIRGTEIPAADASHSPDDPVLIALASNERYFPGLYCTIASALLTLSTARRAQLYILDGKREWFVELGGFNRLFHPAYCEDLELCFRAWRRGWRCVYEPSSVVWHRERASWSGETDLCLNHLVLRNAFLFQWACLPLRKGRGERLVSTAKILAGTIIRGDLHWARTCLEAARVWKQKRQEYAWMKVREQELEEIIKEIVSDRSTMVYNTVNNAQNE